MTCGVNRYFQDGKCSLCDGSCYNCSDYYTCTSCSSQMFYAAGQCFTTCLDGYYGQTVLGVKVCSKCSSSCLNCDAAGCLTCPVNKLLFDKTCIDACPDFYSPAQVNGQNTCIACTSSCQTCSQPVSSQCNSCGKYYQLIS